jgi:hypothetical protein
MKKLQLAFLSLILFQTLSYAAETFPSLSLESLDKSNIISVPNRTTNKFIALGFHPDAQPQLEKGMTLANSLKTTANKLKVVEIPVIDQSYQGKFGLIRPFMKGKVKNKAYIKSVYPYFTNIDTFRSKFGLGKNDKQLFLLVNADGKIIWQKTQINAADLAKIGSFL